MFLHARVQHTHVYKIWTIKICKELFTEPACTRSSETTKRIIWCSGCLMSGWLSERMPSSLYPSAGTSYLLDWWWWWQRRTASSWGPATTPRSVLRSQTCSWCEPAGRPPSLWCFGGPWLSAESGRCCGKARNAGRRRCCRWRRRRGSVCRRQWRWCPCGPRCPPASSSPG